MTAKRISRKPCPNNSQPALRRASKQRGTGPTSPKAKRRKNGGSAKERSNNGSRADQVRAASRSLRSRTSSPGSPSGKLRRDELQLSPTLYDALNIVAAWEHWTFGEMCRRILISFLVSEYGDIFEIIGGNHYSRKEKAWARQHQAALAPLMNELGWNGCFIKGEKEAA